MTEKTQIINKRLDQILYGTEWTHKIHEKVADTFEITDRLLTFISISLHLSNCNDITNSQPWIINSINSE